MIHQEVNLQNKLNISEICANSEKRIPELYKKSPWSALKQRGKDIIWEEYLLDCYFSAYSKRHEFCANSVIRKIPKTIFESPFYVIDWGCGQGIGSLVLCKYLDELGCLDNVAEAYLIDPSPLALRRAKTYIDTWLPTSKSKEKSCFFHEDIKLNFEHNDYPILHIFSNILDVDDIDFHNLAEKIVTFAHSENYFAITSPSYPKGRENIKYFIQFFSDYTILDETNTYDSREQLPYNYYSMLVRLSNKQELSAQRISPNRLLLSALQQFCSADYNTYYKPFSLENNCIDQDSIDFLVIRENYGALFINVVDEKITNLEDLKTEIDKINSQRNSVTDNMPDLAVKVKINKAYYAIPSCAIYLHENSIEEVNNFRTLFKKEDKKYKYCKLLSHNSLNKEGINILLNDSYLSSQSWLFTSSIFSNFQKLLQNNMHYKEQGMQYTFKGKRKELIESKEASKQKIKGFAGSGKTVLLTHRAVNAQKRTGRHILILTYNITIGNYIRQKLQDVYEDFDLSYFIITTYHKFISSSYEKYYKTRINEKNEDFFEKCSDIMLFENVKELINKYDAIFVDEGQDFQTEWFQIIMKYFASEKTEIVIFADEKQNVYNINTDETKQPVTPIKGRWTELAQSFRLDNKLIALAVDFQKNFNNKYNLDNINNVKNEQSSLLNPMIKYTYFENVFYNKLAEIIVNTIKKHHFENETVGILLFTHDAVQEIDYYLRSVHKLETNSMCISKEDYTAYLQKKRDREHQEMDLTGLKKVKKANFIKSDSVINISTIHSFKGWEAENLFLILGTEKNDSENNNTIENAKTELVYTAITRCKKRLFIISTDKTYYHDYFMNSSFIDSK